MICIAENNGEGGVAGGAGVDGQASQSATGAAAHGYGYPVIECVTGTPCDLMVQLTSDYAGNVQSDLSGIASVKLYWRPSMNTAQGQHEKACTFTQDGVVSFSLTEEDLKQQGVFYAEFRCADSAGHDRQNYRAYLCVRKGTKGGNEQGPRTLTVMDVRMAIMDTSAEANTMLDDLEFSDVQILHALQRCIDEWEETPPDLLQHFDATTFPWPEHLLKGVIGFLMQEKAYLFMRNKMNYNASGFTLDTNDRGQAYAQLAMQARAEWKNFVNTKKGELNQDEAFGTFCIPQFGELW